MRKMVPTEKRKDMGDREPASFDYVDLVILNFSFQFHFYAVWIIYDSSTQSVWEAQFVDWCRFPNCVLPVHSEVNSETVFSNFYST